MLDSNGTFNYTPEPNFYGDDSFTYKTFDGFDESEITTVNIIINPVDDLPIAYNMVLSAIEDEPLPIILNATDVETDPTSLQYVIDATPQHGVLSPAVVNSVTYTPNVNYYGEVSFTFFVNDGESDSNTATVVIDVSAVNDIPIVDDISVITKQTGQYRINRIR